MLADAAHAFALAVAAGKFTFEVPGHAALRQGYAVRNPGDPAPVAVRFTWAATTEPSAFAAEEGRIIGSVLCFSAMEKSPLPTMMFESR